MVGLRQLSLRRYSFGANGRNGRQRERERERAVVLTGLVNPESSTSQTETGLEYHNNGFILLLLPLSYISDFKCFCNSHSAFSQEMLFFLVMTIFI